MNAISGLTPSSNTGENIFMSVKSSKGSLSKQKEEKEESVSRMKLGVNVDVSKKLTLSLLR